MSTMSGNVADHEFDVIVVGGGSAGAVMASRLSEDASKNVLLIEAGKCYMPDAYPEQLSLARIVGGDAGSTWAHSREIGSAKASGGLRAKVLGGGSAINAAGFARAPRSDFDRWKADGLHGWSYEQVLPYFKKSESADFGDDQWHGRGGPLPVHLRASSDLTKTAQDFIASALFAGFPYVNDINTPFPKGVGIYPLNINEDARHTSSDLKNREVRVNTGMAYLTKEICDRPNLYILGETLVDKVLIEEGVTRGVCLANGLFIKAAHVVLSAGSIGSGAILLRSGIGPKEHLKALGITTLADLAVGKSLMDQPHVYLQVAINGDDETWPPIGGKVWEQSSLAQPDQLDIYLGFNHFANLSLSSTGKAFGVIACACRPSSRGELQLDTLDPLDSPRVSVNLLSVERDLDILVEAIEMMRRILDEEPLKSRSVALTFSDGSIVPSDRTELKAAIRLHVEPTFHMTPTDPQGAFVGRVWCVVERGRVHGLTGLRVADASIFPDVPSVATNPTVIMAAEYLASMFKLDLESSQ